MHVKIKDLHAGAWLLTGDRYALFVSFAGESLAEVLLYGEEVSTVTPIDDLRPVFINRFIIEQCGFRPTGKIYSDGFFEITIGNASNLFNITGHRIQKPSATHLLSQLHIFQNVYRKETGAELIFNPGGR